jgi:23S rRNA pseudouridine2605 synthase
VVRRTTVKSGRVPARRGRGPRPSQPREAAPAAVAERLQKVLARQGLGSRRQIESWIVAGRLDINGQPATLGSRISPADEVRLDGRTVRVRDTTQPAQLYLCHRSPGDPLRPGTDPAGRASLIERLPRRAGRRFMLISPMPRIDGGLEIATSDGALASELQRRVRGLQAEYFARVRGELSAAQVAALLAGERDAGPPLQLSACEPVDDMPADDAAPHGNRWYRLVAVGASGNDLRQLFERCGVTVSRILRTRLGTLELPRDLPRGAYRALPAEDALSRLLGVEAEAADAPRSV